MKLLVLAGGFGTRLQSVVPQLPKALAPVEDLPFLHFQMENWVRQGVTSFVFLLHYKSEVIIAFLRQGMESVWQNLDIQWVIEESPLGTGGAIANAVSALKIQGDFLVTNADTWLGFGLRDVIQADAPSIGVVRVADVGRYGSVGFDGLHNVTHFVEKGKVGGCGWVNAGVMRLNDSLFKDECIKAASLETNYFPDWVQLKILKVVLLQCDFVDIGVPEDYYKFCRWIEAGKSERLRV